LIIATTATKPPLQAAFSFANTDVALDPYSLPVVAVDSHLPDVPRDRLTASVIRRQFQEPPHWPRDTIADHRADHPRPIAASVLVTLVMRGELTVLFTKRAEQLSDHPGQISFPGGRSDPTDVSATGTALREAREEVGIDDHFIEVVGQLPQYVTVTGFIVTPVVALADPGFTISADPAEVAEVFEVPLSFLMSPKNHQHRLLIRDGAERRVLSIPWTAQSRDGTPQERLIWGATAAMVRVLYSVLSA
jgi:8-oxo-dGTP pyrophosphatase MutT (NUDIX family)